MKVFGIVAAALVTAASAGAAFGFPPTTAKTDAPAEGVFRVRFVNSGEAVSVGLRVDAADGTPVERRVVRLESSSQKVLDFRLAPGTYVAVAQAKGMIAKVSGDTRDCAGSTVEVRFQTAFSGEARNIRGSSGTCPNGPRQEAEGTPASGPREENFRGKQTIHAEKRLPCDARCFAGAKEGGLAFLASQRTAEIRVRATWEPSTAASESLAINLGSREAGILVERVGSRSVEFTLFEPAPGSYRLEAHATGLAGLALDQDVNLEVTLVSF